MPPRAPETRPPRGAETRPGILIAEVAAGNRAAFTALVRHLHPSAQRIAAKVLGNPAETDDALQAAYLKLWTRAGAYDPARGGVEAWFARIVVNACLDRRRSIRPVQPLDEAPEPVCAAPAPDAALATREEAARVARAVARLNPRQRAAILLFYGEEASTADVAEALDTSPKAVEGLLARARSELARMLDDMRAKP